MHRYVMEKRAENMEKLLRCNEMRVENVIVMKTNKHSNYRRQWKKLATTMVWHNSLLGESRPIIWTDCWIRCISLDSTGNFHNTTDRRPEIFFSSVNKLLISLLQSLLRQMKINENEFSFLRLRTLGISGSNHDDSPWGISSHYQKKAAAAA